MLSDFEGQKQNQKYVPSPSLVNGGFTVMTKEKESNSTLRTRETWIIKRFN